MQYAIHFNKVQSVSIRLSLDVQHLNHRGWALLSTGIQQCRPTTSDEPVPIGHLGPKMLRCWDCQGQCPLLMFMNVHERPWSMTMNLSCFVSGQVRTCFRPGEAIKGAYCLTCWSSWSFRTRVSRIGVLFVWTLAWLALKHIDTVHTVDISVQVESLEASNSIQFLRSMKRSSGWGVPLLLVAAVVWTILGWSSKADGATWHDVLKFWISLLVLECLDGFVHSNCKPRWSVCA